MNGKRENPSVFNSLYWLVEDKKIDPRIFLDFSRFFWPSFIEVDGFIFLKEKFEENEYSRLVAKQSNPEYWINIVMLDDYFSETSESEKWSRDLAKSLIEIWGIKIIKDFPEKKVVFAFLEDKEYGDIGLTFYQNK